MNTNLVNAAAREITAAMESGRQTPAGWALALAAKSMLQSPESAAEVELLRARVAELLAERHATNEALDDAARALREQRDRFETLRALCDAADHVGIVSGGWFTVEAVRKAAGESLPKPDGITGRIAPVQALQEGEHYAVVHHAYRVGRDLPETGGGSRG